MNVCVFTHFAEEAFIPKYVEIYLKELSLYFDKIIMVSNERPVTSGLENLPPNTQLMWVKNEGYDLGMFYKAFQAVDLDEVKQIACINDSNVLFHTLKPIFDWGQNSALDFWGIIDSYQRPWFSSHADSFHIQSHFMVFGEEAIKKLPLYFHSLNITRFFNEKDLKKLRQKVINDWEIGLTQFFIEKGLTVGSFVESKAYSTRHQIKKTSNLSHKYYSRLIEEGYPLIKKKVIFHDRYFNFFAGQLPKWEKLILGYGEMNWELEEMISELKTAKKVNLTTQMETTAEAKIYIVYYKPGAIIKNDAFYQPLMSGNSLGRAGAPFVGDDTGENISEKNPFYSELTGIYWIWKNTKQEITGLCHYRRFYTAQPEPWAYRIKRTLYSFVGLGDKRHGLIYTKDIDSFVPKILSPEETKSILLQYDGILPQARKLKYSVEEHYRRYHDINDLKIIESILQEKHPAYLEAFRRVLEGKRLYANNMFILKDPQYQQFMEWWFDMLHEFEERADIRKYQGYQKRIIGFVAERLLTIWFEKEQLKCKELQLIYFKHLKHE